MPFDSSLPPVVQSVAQGFSKPRKPDLTLGVFSFDGAWKLYSESDRASTYASRQDALVAAEERVFAEARAGRKVELFIQDEDGALGQADIDLH